MIQYKFYTNKTVYYMEYGFYQINYIKKAFRDAWQIDAIVWVGKNRHFNF